MYVQTRSGWESRTASVAAAVEKTRALVARVSEVFSRVAEMERWLEQDLEPRLPSEGECRIDDAAQLYRVKGRFQALKDLCDQRATMLCQLNEAGMYLYVSCKET